LAAQKKRLDQVMVARGLAESRAKAQALILAGMVSLPVASGGKARSKPHSAVKAGTMIPEDAPIDLIEPPRWVGRGGEKLEGAILDLGLTGRIGGSWLDAGASTGGFVDVLLASGASRVYAVDVGYGQLDERLRHDFRVVVLERQNVRSISRNVVPIPLDGVTLDLSFISARIALAHLRAFMKSAAAAVVLVKPQFEGERRDVGKGGIVRDEETRRRIFEDFRIWCRENGWMVHAEAECRIRGRKGNQERFFHLGFA
jgi:23S rRNA (cytidine1920-2'-O)/16S rRNA (cytidine1409-2'-O)-methyltransferase